MTTRANASVVCGNCGQTSEQAVIFSTNEMGSPDLDLRPPEGRRSTMDTWLQACPACGHVAEELDEAPADPAVLTTEAYEAALASPGFPPLARRFLAHAVASGAAADPGGAGRSLLRAAWVCDDAGEASLAADCRRRAAAALGEVPEDADAGPRAAVRVDALRRAGDADEAAAACEAALELPAAAGFLRDVLLFQRRLIGRGDTAAYTLDALEEDGDD